MNAIITGKERDINDLIFSSMDMNGNFDLTKNIPIPKELGDINTIVLKREPTILYISFKNYWNKPKELLNSLAKEYNLKLITENEEE